MRKIFKSGAIRPALAVLALGACAVAVPAAAADKVKIGIVGSATDVIHILADKNGFFREENIAPEFINFISATTMIAPLANGDLDVGGGGPSAGMYNAAMRGIKLKIVADKGSMAPGNGFMPLIVRKDLYTTGKVRGLADLKGLKVGDTSKAGSGDVTLDKALRSVNLTFNDVDKLYMGIPQLAAALENGALDATFMLEPMGTTLVAKGSAVMLATGDTLYPNQQLAVILYGEAFAQKRDVAQRFMNAWVKGARIYNDALKDGRIAGKGADEMLQLLVENTNVKDKDVYRRMIAPAINPDGAVNAAGLKQDYLFYKGQGWIEGDIDPDSLVDNSFANHTRDILGPYRKPAN
ncbi:ABC transporter substrate-binding protein [Roseiarcaceae bacterium H3SJ34-1]|uniref:ABC transporter substrate-binding protein n=1 Tax=Terripilifer ovatus TaxID=3032367 RepID=UPI003AB944C3|nr:ABC transporter substrate-binding protein [Roseiarcaceae bacterium H3SJ34-1]